MPIVQSPAISVNGLPNGNERINPEGSPYLGAAPTALDVQATSDLVREIFDQIFDTGSENYWDCLKLQLFGKTPVEVTSDVFSWDENPDQRTAITIDNGVAAAGTQLFAATVAVAGGYVTRTVPVPAAQQSFIQLNGNVAFTATAAALVINKDPGNNLITLRSYVGEGIPAIIQGAKLAQLGESTGDEQIGWVNTQRSSKIQRWNTVGTFRRALKYGRKEHANRVGNSRNDNLEMENRNLIREAKIDAFQNMWIGRKGTRQLADGTYAKGMDGLHTQMVNGGSTFADTTVANLVPTFEAHTQASNQKSAGGRRTVYARQEVLTVLSKAYKDNHIRMRPEDMRANIDLEAIRVGGQIYEFCCTELLGDPNFMPVDMKNRMYIIDDMTVDPVRWDAFPMFDMGRMIGTSRGDYTKLPQVVQDNLQRQDFSVRDVELCFSMRMLDPRKSVAINVTDL